MSVGHPINFVADLAVSAFEKFLKESDGCPDLPILDDILRVVGRDLIFCEKMKNLFGGFFVK